MYKAFLSLRYLRTRYIALASIVSVMLGVATMIVVNSVMKGFTSEMRNRIQGLLSDIVIETNSLDGQENVRQRFGDIRHVAGDKIKGMTATVEVWGLMTFQFHNQITTRPVTVIGIEPEEKATVGPLVHYLESYQTVYDGKKLVRPPLRGHDVKPGWSLTKDAFAWRKEMKQQERWLQERLDEPHGLSENGGELNGPIRQIEHHNPASVPLNSETPSVNSKTPSADSKSTPAPPKSTSGAPAVAEPPQRSSAPSDSTLEDPFENETRSHSAHSSSSRTPLLRTGVEPIESRQQVPPPLAPANEPVDEDGPMEARVYIGANLVRFQHENSKTGEKRTIEMVRPGEDVKISTVSAGRPPKEVSFSATVVDIFKCGMSEYDSNLVFCNLSELQKNRGMVVPGGENDPDKRAVTSIQIKLHDYADAPEVIERLKAVFSPGIWTIKTWEQKQGPLLAAVEIETGILNVLLFLIIAVAGFGILAIFYMIVVEKTRDIGILKALGASSGGVMSIFLSYGLALGLVGSGVGVLLGLFVVRYINEIESAIAAVTGRKVFDDKVYYFPRIPTLVEPSTVVWVTLGAVAIAIMASVLPARRAARLRPVESLRYE